MTVYVMFLHHYIYFVKVHKIMVVLLKYAMCTSIIGLVLSIYLGWEQCGVYYCNMCTNRPHLVTFIILFSFLVPLDIGVCFFDFEKCTS